jgi:hypothetical protein
MRKNQRTVRTAAQKGSLHALPAQLLKPENFLSLDEAGGYHAIPEDGGPLQNAAFWGQLRFLPAEARTVRALLDCGHPKRNLEDPFLVTFEDAFFRAAIGGKLGQIPNDDNFKADLIKYREEIIPGLKRAIAQLTSAIKGRGQPSAPWAIATFQENARTALFWQSGLCMGCLPEEHGDEMVMAEMTIPPRRDGV